MSAKPVSSPGPFPSEAALPKVALLGRPNVGKSTLFNRLIRSNRAITHDRPGVTRDRMEGFVRSRGEEPFILIDTGGVTLDSHARVEEGPEGIRGFEAAILEQVRDAVQESVLLCLVVDGRDGLTPFDQHLAEYLRKLGKPLLLVVNKVDGPEKADLLMAEFHGLGLEILPCSAAHGYNVRQLEDELRTRLFAFAVEEEGEADAEELLLDGATKRMRKKLRAAHAEARGRAAFDEEGRDAEEPGDDTGEAGREAGDADPDAADNADDNTAAWTETALWTAADFTAKIAAFRGPSTPEEPVSVDALLDALSLEELALLFEADLTGEEQRLTRAALGRKGVELAPEDTEAPDIAGTRLETEGADEADRDEEDPLADSGLGPLRMALLGRPNAGKSSLVNTLVGRRRMIVSDVAGTTRDSVDVDAVVDGEACIFVDTAGVRRRPKIVDTVERYSVNSSLKSTTKAHVTLLVLDVTEGFTQQDKRLIDLLHERKTPFMVLVNKSDLIDPSRRKEVEKEYKEALVFCPHVPLLFVSAKNRHNLRKIVPLAGTIRRECGVRVPTGQLNRAMTAVLDRHQPPLVKRVRAKFFYLTQAESAPPTFVFFVNDAERVLPSYARYLERSLRKIFGIIHAPMRVHFRSSHKKKTAGK